MQTWNLVEIVKHHPLVIEVFHFYLVFQMEFHHQDLLQMTYAVGLEKESSFI